MKSSNLLTALFFLLGIMVFNTGLVGQQYKIVDTGQEEYYDSLLVISEPSTGEAFYGQDANYTGNKPTYQDNGDGTVTDLVSGLMWVKSPDMNGDGDINYDDKMSYDEAVAGAETFNLASYDDWRLPSIKEMYSLIDFSGLDPSGYEGTSTEDLVPFIDTDYFDFNYGDQNAGERIIDAQMASSNIYVGLTMGGDETMFGVNFADGRIKGYGTGPMPGQTDDKMFYVMYVRENTEYGTNNFQDNGDGTITDIATGLMWTQDDDGQGMKWEDALSYAEAFELVEKTDWRLPNAKELQSIVDYTRAPSTSNSAAIDPLFNCTQITDEGGEIDYPFYWSGTTHANWQENAPGGWGAYVCFGEALGFMEEPPMSGNYVLMDVHGAGAQRSDPKSGNPDDYPNGNGPQGDVVRIFNFVRLVRDVDSATGINDMNQNNMNINVYPNPATNFITVDLADNEGISTISISNIMGSVLYSETKDFSRNTTINVVDLTSGLYILTYNNSTGIVSKKFLKK